MKKNILLTCFGGNISYEVLNDFQVRKDLGLFISDVNPAARASFLTKDLLAVLPSENPRFCPDLLEKVRAKNIQMIIPGGDEEAFALMKGQKLFEEAGIVTAVQSADLLPLFSAKSAMYAHLQQKGFPIPKYRCFKTKEEFEASLQAFDYPQKPLLIKPDSARGGRGVLILSEKMISNKDNLMLLDRHLFEQTIDGKTAFIAMEYIEGIVYDVDVLVYKNGEQFFGIRKRFNNVSQNFSGNIFEENEALLSFSKKLYEAFPTKFLVDYDVMVDKEGNMHLLEINPRPSGSTISYIPFGVNLYYALAKSYLDNEHIPLQHPKNKAAAVAFHKMVGGDLK